MKLDIFTLFPEAFDWFRSQRSVQNAIGEGNELRLFNYRDSTPLSAGQVDDAPYGGGAGMVLRVDVVGAAGRLSTWGKAAHGPALADRATARRRACR
jgi:tRNA (guanine37-N1)-methyltransferase